jgi:hypothetical protein
VVSESQNKSFKKDLIFDLLKVQPAPTKTFIALDCFSVDEQIAVLRHGDAGLKNFINFNFLRMQNFNLNQQHYFFVLDLTCVQHPQVKIKLVSL